MEKWNFQLQGEYINGKDIGSSLVGGGCGTPGVPTFGNFDKSGYWGALMYTFKDKFAPIVKYQSYTVSSDVSATQTLTEMIFGFNYYFNDWTRFQLNYVMTTDSDLQDPSKLGLPNEDVPAYSNAKGYMKNYLVVQMQVKFN